MDGSYDNVIDVVHICYVCNAMCGICVVEIDVGQPTRHQKPEHVGVFELYLVDL